MVAGCCCDAHQSQTSHLDHTGLFTPFRIHKKFQKNVLHWIQILSLKWIKTSFFDSPTYHSVDGNGDMGRRFSLFHSDKWITGRFRSRTTHEQMETCGGGGWNEIWYKIHWALEAIR